MAFGLAYLMLVRVLSWLALLARSETAEGAKVIRCATRSPCCAAPTLDRYAPGSTGGGDRTGYTPPVTAEFVIDAYHRLFQIEASFRMSKHDLAARPIYHHKRGSIEAHLSIVFAALAVGRMVEERTEWSIRRFVHTARRYRTVQIRAGQHLLTAEYPLPDDLREALALITGADWAR